jgi:hypothetical protein
MIVNRASRSEDYDANFLCYWHDAMDVNYYAARGIIRDRNVLIQQVTDLTVRVTEFNSYTFI